MFLFRLFCFTGVHSRGCLAFLISSSPLYFFHVFIQRDDSPLFIISRPTSFSVIHVNEDIKILSKKRFDFVVVFLPKSPGGHAIYRKKARLLEMQNLTPAYMKGCTYVQTILSEPKFDDFSICVNYDEFPFLLHAPTCQ